MSLAQHSKKDRVGIIGLGAMGSAMARAMLLGGERVLGYDIQDDARTRFSESGGLLTRTPEELVRSAPIVLTCLPNSAAWVDVAETRLLPHAQNGQVFIDTGTTLPMQIRRVAQLMARKGAVLLDAPVSGGVAEAERGELWVFCGGDIDAFKRVRVVLERFGSKEHVRHCGASGSGQVMKGVEQLAQGLTAAALMEALAYGFNSGVRIELMHDILGGDGGLRSLIGRLCEQVEKNAADALGIGWGNYKLFLEEASKRQFSLPAAKALHLFLRNADKPIAENGLPAPSFWREMTQKGGMGSRKAGQAPKRKGGDG